MNNFSNKTSQKQFTWTGWVSSCQSLHCDTMAPQMARVQKRVDSVGTVSESSTSDFTQESFQELKAQSQRSEREKRELIASHLSSASVVWVNDAIKSQTRRCVKCTLFHEIKFIKSNAVFEDLTTKKTFGRKVLSQFSVNGRHKEHWSACKKIAKSALNVRRSDVQCGIQHQVSSMWQKTDWMNNDSPEDGASKDWLKGTGTMVEKGKSNLALVFRWLKGQDTNLCVVCQSQHVHRDLRPSQWKTSCNFAKSEQCLSLCLWLCS